MSASHRATFGSSFATVGRCTVITFLEDTNLNSLTKVVYPSIEGFGGKRAVAFLLKSELCQKGSKFRMQLCLGVFSDVLHVFCLKFASFLRHYVCKKHIFFLGHPLGTFC